MNSSPVRRYGFINAKLRAKISSILPDDFREGLLRAPTLEDVFAFLNENGFSRLTEVYTRTGDLQAVEAELFIGQIEQYREVVRNTEGSVRDFSSALTVKLEIENLKNLLRLWYGSRIKKRPMDHRVGYIYKERILHAIPWDALINAASLADIAEALGDSPYQAVVQPYVGTPVEQEGIFFLETSLDRFYYRFLLDEAAKLPTADRRTVKKILTAEIDLQNLSWITRFSRFYALTPEELTAILLPGGYPFSQDQVASILAREGERPGQGPEPGIPREEGSHITRAAGVLSRRYPALQALAGGERGGSASARAAMFEQLLDQVRRKEFVKIITGYPFTIGIVLVYFFLRSRESRFLTTVFNGKFYGWEGSRMREFAE